VPSELDVTMDLGARLDKLELHLAYERDMPVDGGGFVQHLVQHFVLLYATWAFELVHNTAAARAPSAAHEPEPNPCDE
jgi:hypothetical protein